MSDNITYLSKVLFSGGVGGTALTLSGHPLDTIKVTIQTMKKVDGRMPFSGTFDCAKQIVNKNGIKGLYAGLGPPLTFISIIFSVRFFGFQLGKRLQQTKDNQQLSARQLFQAGVLAGLTSSFVTAPVERIKCILQSQNSLKVKQFQGPIHCFKSIYRSDGMRSVYRGLSATLARDCPNLAIYYLTYELTNRKLNKTIENKNLSYLSPFITLLSGACAGYSYWVFGIPVDVVKSRLQSTVSLSTYKNGARSVLSELIKKEGLRSLYRGTMPVLIRAPIANSFCFLGYETAMKALNMMF